MTCVARYSTPSGGRHTCIECRAGQLPVGVRNEVQDVIGIVAKSALRPDDLCTQQSGRSQAIQRMSSIRRARAIKTLRTCYRHDRVRGQALYELGFNRVRAQGTRLPLPRAKFFKRNRPTSFYLVKPLCHQFRLFHGFLGSFDEQFQPTVDISLTKGGQSVDIAMRPCSQDQTNGQYYSARQPSSHEHSVDKRSANASIAVREGMNGFKLRMDQGGLNKRPVGRTIEIRD